MNYPSFTSRIRTAAILIAVLAVLITVSLYGGIFSWGLILGSYVFVIMAAFEAQHACLHDPLHRSTIGGYIAKACFLLAIVFPATIILLLRIDTHYFREMYLAHRFLPIILLTNGISLFAILLPVVFQARESLSQVERKVLERMIVLLLIGLGGASLVSIAAAPDSVSFFIWLVLVVAMNDSSAYFIGAKIKTSPLSPVVSPKKTVLGSAAGLVGGVIAGSATYFLLPPITNWYVFIFCLLFLNFLAQLGDLLKSLIKRIHGIKDMGTVLPGHGGVLDRIDGLLLASPFAISLLLVLREVS